MENKKSDYRYSPLNSTQQTIRLFKVLPGAGSTTHALLEDALLDDVKGQYDAISYVWGNPAPCRHVVIDGKQVRVRDNIYQCLKHLRQHRLVSKPLWIDCICINQADDAEKEQQVASMSKIFSSARTVHMWLGRTSLLFQPEQDLGHAVFRIALHSSSPWESLDTIVQRRDPIALAVIDYLMRLVYDEYWHRIWIVQEVALASNARMVMGDMLVDAEKLVSAYLAAKDASKPVYYAWLRRQNDENFQDRGTEILGAHPLLRVQHRSSEVEDVGLAKLIETHRTKQSTDPRDRIYGLLGLTSSCHVPPVDYRCSVELLLLRTMDCLMAEIKEKDAQQPGGTDGETLTSEPWFVACVMQSLNITAKKLTSAITCSSTLAQEYTRQFEVTLAAFEIVSPCTRAPSDQPTLEEQCTSIQAPSGQTEHFWKRQVWLGRRHLEKRFSVKEPGVPLLICSIRSLPVFMLRLETSQQVRVERLLSFDLSTFKHEPIRYKSRYGPSQLIRSLNAKLNALRTDWRDAFDGKFFDMHVPLSGLEMVELAETYDFDSTRYDPRDRDLDWRMVYTVRGHGPRVVSCQSVGFQGPCV